MSTGTAGEITSIRRSPFVCEYVTTQPKCVVDDCEKNAEIRELCRRHNRRQRLYGHPLGMSERAAKRGKGFVDPKGYRRIGTKRDGKWKDVAEHRLVMEAKLGRRLRPNENVHHINGDRLDNRPENLELWIKTQPSGQRAADLVAWAKEILELYGNE